VQRRAAVAARVRTTSTTTFRSSVPTTLDPRLRGDDGSNSRRRFDDDIPF
jgi:hypothetical protein